MDKWKRHRRGWIIAAILLGTAWFSPQPSKGQPQCNRSISGNGAAVATAGDLVLTGTIGQGAIGPVITGGTTLNQGFWYDPAFNQRHSAGIREEASGVDQVIRAAPNPFSQSAHITLSLSERSMVSLRLYDALGRLVGVLMDEERPSGQVEIMLNGDLLPTGRYTLVSTINSEQRYLTIQLVR